MSSARSSASQSTLITSNQQDNQKNSGQADQAEYQAYIQAVASQSELEIAGIEHPTVICYFEWLNQAAYDQAVMLFAEDGILYAPFESGIQGRSAIANYLKTEAKGMRLQPREGMVQPTGNEADEQSEDEPTYTYQILVTGKVQTSVFSVNVQWTFTLNSDDLLTAVRVKLLASPKELLNLRR